MDILLVIIGVAILSLQVTKMVKDRRSKLSVNEEEARREAEVKAHFDKMMNYSAEQAYGGKK